MYLFNILNLNNLTTHKFQIYDHMRLITCLLGFKHKRKAQPKQLVYYVEKF